MAEPQDSIFSTSAIVFPSMRGMEEWGVRFSKSDSTIVEDIFRDLDIRSDTENAVF